MDNANSITNSNFNARVPTVIVAHGWLSNQYTDINPTIRDGKCTWYYVNCRIVLKWKEITYEVYFDAKKIDKEILFFAIPQFNIQNKIIYVDS